MLGNEIDKCKHKIYEVKSFVILLLLLGNGR